jgi:DNA helicase-2/ATP-dependent DNA helicase PcrA
MTLPRELQNLNARQSEAVQHFTGPILVLAGAGSGKTRVLTRRVAHLVLHHRIRPQSILAVTFTNKATEEMRHRLREMLGDESQRLWVATFHSASLRMLRRHATLLGYTNDFVVYDADDSKALLKQLLKELNIDDKKSPVQSFTRTIDQLKNAFIRPAEYAKQVAGTPADEQALVYDRYQRALMQANAMDFGDLLLNATALLEEHHDIRALYQRHIQFVLVDEFQDTNPVQYRFIRLLTAQHNNLLVVGDDDQSIYAFRGATIRNILEFEKDHPGSKVVTLDQNYRSTGNVLELAHAVIERNKQRKDKKLWTAAGKGDPTITYLGDDETDEASFVAHEIRRLVDSGASFSDIAIFYRTNAQSRALEEAMVGSEIPYRIYGGLRFYDRAEIRDILAYLRLLVNDADGQAFLRIVNTPPRGIGAQSIQRILNLAREKGCTMMDATRQLQSQNKSLLPFVTLIDDLRREASRKPLGVLIEEIFKRTEYLSRLQAQKDPTALSRIENLRELQAIGTSMAEGSAEPSPDMDLELDSSPDESPFSVLQRFLDRVSLTASADKASSSNAPDEQTTVPAPTVSLMTLHLAKGLEFPYVFLTGLEEGLLPHHRSLDDPTGIEEERRLCYVGITRAMKQLYITRAMERGMFSAGDGFGRGGLFRDVSRFAFDFPESCFTNRDRNFLTGGYTPATPQEPEDNDQTRDDGDELRFEPEVSTMPLYRRRAPTQTTLGSGAVTTADALSSTGTTSSGPTSSGPTSSGPTSSGPKKRF